MATLLLRLAGPMQSWGTTSRFDQRDTGREPSKSGVLGLLAGTMGIEREDWAALEPLTRLSMGIRHDRPGILQREYQSAGCARSDSIVKAGGEISKEGIVSIRFYLADAVFLVALEGDDRGLLERMHSCVKNPRWPISLGRKSYVPSEPVWIKDGLQEAGKYDLLTTWPWLGKRRPYEEIPEELLISLESRDGSGVLRMDQPLSSFADRRFGARYVRSEKVPFPEEKVNVPE